MLSYATHAGVLPRFLIRLQTGPMASILPIVQRIRWVRFLTTNAPLNVYSVI